MTSNSVADAQPTQGRASRTRAAGRRGVESAATPWVSQQDTEQTFDRLVDEGVQRVGRSWLGLTATGLLGGFDVGLGILALLLVEHYTHSTVLAGLAFVIGFIALTISHSELFTEDFLVPVAAVAARQARLRSLLRLWVVSLVTNLIGGWLVMGLVMASFPDLRSNAVEAASFYIHLGTTWPAFALAILGGLAITLMTHMQHATSSEGVRLVPAVVMPFLLGAGKLNHAIVVSLLCFAALQAGAPFGYADWLGLLVLATAGNIVGGVGIVTGLRLLQVPHKVLGARSTAG
jgi:formate-nitrite transporter family protein